MIPLLIFLAVLVILVFWLISIYNNLVRFKNQVKNAWAQIDVQLQRRYDLIPNLVEAVKGYMKHERETLDSVVQARSAAVSARENIQAQGGPTEGSLQDLVAAEKSLQGAMGRLSIQVEAYPDLKASQNMQQLQEELATTENKVAFSRQAYNDQVMNYNTAQEVLPASLFARSFGHKPADSFEVEDDEVKKSVKVSF
jgi:LemA protein